MQSEARREESFTLRQANFASVGILSPSELRNKVKKSSSADTFFVLGSGASVADLTPANFEEISRQVSVGINNWGVHDFIPDMYSLESVPKVGDGRGLSRALELLSREDVLNRRPLILVLKPRTERELVELVNVPAVLRENLSFYGRIGPATRLASNLRDDISDYFSYVNTRFPSVLLDSGASVIRMINLGILLGFRKIVLLGVDLNGSPYFWEKNTAYSSDLAREIPISHHPAGAHETTLQSSRAFDVVTFVRVLSQYFAEELDGEILVGSSYSRLAEFLPVVSWNR